MNSIVKTRNVLFVLVMSVFLAVSSLWGAGEIKVPQVQTKYISMEVETPHVKWARPYHLGKIRAIVFKDGNIQREIIELAQRVDLDLDTTYLYEKDVKEAIADYYGITTKAQLKAGLARLFARNEDWQVMVIPGPMFNRCFSEEQQQMVLDKVRAGSGLILIDPDNSKGLAGISHLRNQRETVFGPWVKEKDHFITNGIPFSVLPATETYDYDIAEGGDVLVSSQGKGVVVVSHYGKGRVVEMAYWAGYGTKSVAEFCGLIPHMNRQEIDLAPAEPTFGYYEYHFSMLAKALLWAAKKEPTLLISDINATSERLTLGLDNQGGAAAVKVVVRVSDKYGKVLGEGEKDVEVSGGDSKVTVAIPGRLRNGLNLIDVWIKDANGAVINWSSTAIDMQEPVRIAAVEVDRPFFRPGDAVNIEVRLDGEITEGCSLTVKLWDGFDRLLVEETRDGVSVKEYFAMRLTDPVNRQLVVETLLSDGRGILDRNVFHKVVEFPIRKSAHEGDPIYVGWTVVSTYGLNNYLWDAYNKLLRGYGFNSIICSEGDQIAGYWDNLTRNNMLIQARGGYMGGRKPVGDDPDHPIREYCLNDEVAVYNMEGWVGHRMSWPGVYAMQGGDESSYAGGRDICFSTHCMAAMRKWLQKEYASLDALNKQWGTEFGSWREVVPLTLKETKRRGDGNYSSWCDHRSFGEVSVANYLRRMNKTVNKIKPGAAHGMSGNPQPGAYCGFDYWQLKDASGMLDSYVAYNELYYWADDSYDIRKWAQPRGGMDEVRVNMWYHLMKGVTGLSLCGTQHIFNLDWTDAKTGEAYRAIYGPFEKGVGRLMVEGRRQFGPIAIHYSRNSSRIAHVMDLRGSETLWRDARWELEQIIEMSGFDNGWISYEQLENGKAKDYRVIMLPMSCSLSDKETAELKKFVEQGGVLVGQLAAGIADGHGKMRDRGSLDEVFGIVRQESEIRKTRDRSVSVANSMGLHFPEMPLVHLEYGLKAGSATVLATAGENKIPLAFANKYGEGLAVYIACDMSLSYSRMDSSRSKLFDAPDTFKSRLEAENFLTEVIQKGSVDRTLGLATEDGEYPGYVKTSYFKNGDFQYFILLRIPGLVAFQFNGQKSIHRGAKDYFKEPQNITVKFPQKGYVYEILADKRFEGERGGVETVFTPTTLQIFSVIPYKVESVELAFPEQSVRGGKAIAYNVAIKAKGKLGNHTLRMDVFDPDGDESSWYSHNITAEAGKAKGVIPIAMNDKKGIWKIRLKDLTSGAQTTGSFQVE